MNNIHIHQIPCPVCKRSEQVFLLEDFYFGLIEKDPKIITRFNLSSSQIKFLSQQITPPSLDRSPIWLIISPDIIFTSFFLIIIIALIFSTNSMTINAWIFPLLLGISYFLFRKKLNSLYQQKKNDRMEAINKAQRAADDWSSYFICLKDRTVFSGHSDNYFPVDALQSRLK